MAPSHGENSENSGTLITVICHRRQGVRPAVCCHPCVYVSHCMHYYCCKRRSGLQLPHAAYCATTRTIDEAPHCCLPAGNTGLSSSTQPQLLHKAAMMEAATSNIAAVAFRRVGHLGITALLVNGIPKHLQQQVAGRARGGGDEALV